jgi:putative ATP-dependent endonuclease of OLD family
MVSVHEVDNEVSAVSVCGLTIDPKLKKKLQRYLDATRAELFFARRILMVEGIAEAILRPVLAKIADGCLKESAVTVLNADGINFNAFLPLFGDEGLRTPVVIMTDGDAPQVGGEPSAAATGLKGKEGILPNLRVEMSEITFEHELARSDKMLTHMVTAFKTLHRNNGAKLERSLAALGTDDEKADEFLRSFLDTKVSKGQFAQELAAVLEEEDLPTEAVPKYIRETLTHLGVVARETEDGDD